MENKFDIEHFLDLSDYVNDTRKNRRKNNKEGKSTAEFFTPYSIVKKMADKISPEDWADPDKTFLEPAQGNGQFTIFILYRRIHEYNISWRKALETMFTVELMEDNVHESRQRIHELLRNIAPDYLPSVADEIMDKNFVCHDFFTWDFENWCPLKQPKKKNEGDNGQLLFKFYNNKSIVKEPTPKQKSSKQHKQKSTPNAKQLPIDFN